MSRDKYIFRVVALILLISGQILNAQIPGTKKWGFNTGEFVNSSPAIGSDGTIYVGSWDSKLYAINPDGSLKWEFLIGSHVASSPAIGSDGTIYVGSYYSGLYAINPDGSKKWEFKSIGSINSSPAIGSDGTIYIGSFDRKLYAINPDGSKKWEFQTGGEVWSSPAINAKGTIYLGSNSDKKLFAINPDGSKKWEFLTQGYVSSSPAIGSDSTIYFGSWDSKLYAINPDGSKKWEFLTGRSVRSSPVIGTDSTIYIGSYDNKLYALNPDGSKKWEFLTQGYVDSSPAIGSDGTIYIGSLDSKLYAINPDGSKKWEFQAEKPIYSPTAIGFDGTVYVGIGKDYYAIYGETTGLADSPWPKFRHDNSNSGNLSFTEALQIQLKIDSIELPGSIIVGDTVHINWQLRNIDTISIVETEYMDVAYISFDTVWDINDKVLSFETITINLQPGETLKRELSIPFPGVPESNYYIIIRSNHMRYQLLQYEPEVSDLLAVNYRELKITDTTNDSIINNQRIYYKFQVPDSLTGQTLILYLEEDTKVSNSEMYLSLYTIPSENDYKIKSIFSDTLTKLIIPQLEQGVYYLMIKGNVSSPDGQPFRVHSEIPDIDISSFNPEIGGNTGFVTVKFEGVQFELFMNATLTKGEISIKSDAIYFIDPTTFFAMFDLGGMQMGTYDVVVESESGSKLVIKDGFEIVQGIPPNLITNFSGVSATRSGWTEVITFTYKNGGNTDITRYTALITSEGESPVSFTDEGLTENTKEVLLLLQHPESPYAIIRPGEEYSIPIYTKIKGGQFQLNLSILK